MLIRTPLHILLSGLCTGLIAQPFFAAAYFTYFATQEADYHKLKIALTLRTIGAGSALYFVVCTILLIALVSIERWLHMSRRSLITSRCGQYFTVVFLLLAPIPVVICRVLATESQTYGKIMSILIVTITLLCYLATLFAYSKVYRIIRHHHKITFCQN